MADFIVVLCLPIVAAKSLVYFWLFCWMKTFDMERDFSFNESEIPPETDVNFFDLFFRKTDVLKVCFLPTDTEMLVSSAFLV